MHPSASDYNIKKAIETSLIAFINSQTNRDMIYSEVSTTKRIGLVDQSALPSTVEEFASTSEDEVIIAWQMGMFDYNRGKEDFSIILSVLTQEDDDLKKIFLTCDLLRNTFWDSSSIAITDKLSLGGNAGALVVVSHEGTEVSLIEEGRHIRRLKINVKHAYRITV